MKILCLYNKKAGGERAIQKIDAIKSAFVKNDIDVDFVFPDKLEDIFSQFEKRNLNNYSGIAIAGGDGSFFNAINAYFKLNNRIDIPFGVIPIGTGNSLSRDVIEGENEVDEFVKIIKKGKTKYFDLAKVKTEDDTFYYANMMGFGFITDIVETAAKLKIFGQFSYTLGVLYRTMKMNTLDLKMTVDGVEHNLDNLFVIISNSRFTGGNYLVAPKAKLDDGKLDLIIMNKLSRINLLKTFPKIFDGSHVDTEFVDYIHAKEIKFETNVPTVLAPDGEVYGQFPMVVSCVPKAIRMFVE